MKITRFDALQYIIEAARKLPSATLSVVLVDAQKEALLNGDKEASWQLDGTDQECIEMPCQKQRQVGNPS